MFVMMAGVAVAVVILGRVVFVEWTWSARARRYLLDAI